LPRSSSTSSRPRSCSDGISFEVSRSTTGMVCVMRTVRRTWSAGTSPQPSGIRASDAAAWALEILERYTDWDAGAPPTVLSGTKALLEVLGQLSNPTGAFRDFLGRARTGSV